MSTRHIISLCALKNRVAWGIRLVQLKSFQIYIMSAKGEMANLATYTYMAKRGMSKNLSTYDPNFFAELGC